MKLTNLKPRLSSNCGRVAVHAPVRPDAVPRVRGWKGVQDRNRIRARDRGQCQQCRREGREHVGVGTDVDHIVPLWKGGSDHDSNKEMLCKEHHDAKSAREAAERFGRG